MILGTVNGAIQAWVAVTVFDGAGRPHEVPALIDTGYSSFLALPPDVIQALGLSFHNEYTVTVASGASQKVRRYRGTVRWDGVVRSILIDESFVEPLVGMYLLAGCDLRIEVTPNGVVEIDTSSQQALSAVFGDEPSS